MLNLLFNLEHVHIQLIIHFILFAFLFFLITVFNLEHVSVQLIIHFILISVLFYLTNSAEDFYTL